MNMIGGPYTAKRIGGDVYCVDGPTPDPALSRNASDCKVIAGSLNRAHAYGISLGMKRAKDAVEVLRKFVDLPYGYPGDEFRGKAVEVIAAYEKGTL